MLHNFFGETIQAFVTAKCGMGCPRCSLKGQSYPDMSVKTFEEVVRVLPELGVKRLELFANDPLKHPQIEKFVEILNGANLNSTILTVGATSHNDYTISGQFFRVLKSIDPKKISFVFSVDHTKKRIAEILSAGENHPEFPAAIKAMAFWQLAPLLNLKKISFRTNTVINRSNYTEVEEILDRVVALGGLVSFCHAQHTPPEFYRVFEAGELGTELEKKLRGKMESVEFLSRLEMESIIRNVKQVIRLRQTRYFNNFRGDNPSEAEIPEKDLLNLHNQLLSLKKFLGGSVLPGEDFISSLGDEGFGCLNLLKAGKFPQIKIGTEGQLVFCCDTHDPITRSYKLENMLDPEIRESFLHTTKTNSYIWTCLLFPCSWSVNHVKYASRKEEINAR
ncbi:MAG: hypothetical protein Q7R75_01855 [bacterium]|nr:hypothetical protein [bacterium]